MIRGISRSVFLAGVISAAPSFAGVGDTPLPEFADGKAGVVVKVASGVVKRLRLQTEAVCTSQAGVAVDIGVEVFDAQGTLLNDVNAGVGAVLDVAPGATVTIGTSATAGLLETTTIPLAEISQGSARVVATSTQVRCIFLVIDDAVTPPVTVGTLGEALSPVPGPGMAGRGMPQFTDGQAATHALVIPGVVKRGRMETNVFCTSLASGPVDIGVEVYGPDGALRNDVGAGNGALLGVGPGVTVTLGTTGTAAYLEDTVITIAGVAQGVGRVVSTSGEILCAAQIVDAAVTPPVGMSALAVMQSSVSGTPVPTATATLPPTATPTATPTGDPANACAATPLPCDDAEKGGVALKADPSAPAKRNFLWKWLKGTVAGQSEFGNPLSGTSYGLCLYENGQRVVAAGISGGGACGGRACWKTISDRGFSYKNKATNGSGVFKMILKAGIGKAKILVKGRGAKVRAPLSTPLFATSADVTVQLVRTDAPQCWQQVFTAPAVKNRDWQFKDKHP